MSTSNKNFIYQFKVTLDGISPLIWRKIQVTAKYTFWDLHVALQDAMGWFDSHLHMFLLSKLYNTQNVEIGIWFEDNQALPGWEIPISDYFAQPGKKAVYQYDFGDGWSHEVLLEGILIKEKGVKYPRCISGERACPPEDCGGIPGYFRLLAILKNPDHDEHEEIVDWLKGHLINYYPYNPDRFYPEKVHFWNPQKRLKMAFSEKAEH
ncbi:MAG: plasmid pRiA4b ORF-3 family protein [Desulfobaccales bacterium]